MREEERNTNCILYRILTNGNHETTFQNNKRKGWEVHFLRIEISNFSRFFFLILSFIGWHSRPSLNIIVATEANWFCFYVLQCRILQNFSNSPSIEVPDSNQFILWSYLILHFNSMVFYSFQWNWLSCHLKSH